MLNHPILDGQVSKLHENNSNGQYKCKTYPPHPLLRNSIKFFFLFECDYDIGLQAYDRVTPDGCVEINFNLSKSYERKNSDEEPFLLDQFYLLSRTSNHYFLRPLARVRMIGVRFYPWGLRSFMKYSMSEIAGKVYSQEDIFGSMIKELHDQVLNTASSENAITRIENFFIKNLYDGQKFDPIISNTVNQILNSQGKSISNGFQPHHNLSRRRLEQRFKDTIGVSMGMFSRLARFQHALKLLGSNGHEHLYNIGYLCGYFDQAHFIRDFKYFAGITPKQYVFENHPLNDLMTQPKDDDLKMISF